MGYLLISATENYRNLTDTSINFARADLAAYGFFVRLGARLGSTPRREYPATLSVLTLG